jgi:uncharacterized membrane protein
MQRVFLCFATVFSLLAATAVPAEIRKWTSKDGQYSTEAELVEFDKASVTLKKTTGETVTVPLERLSEADRRYLRTPKKKPTAAKEKKEKKEKKEPAVSYTNDVQPFLMQYCAECHKPGKAKDGYDVTGYAELTRQGSHGVLVVPGDSDKSRLSAVLQGMSKSMPPAKSAQPTEEEVAKITAWIEAGAKDDSQPAGKGRTSRSRKTSR